MSDTTHELDLSKASREELIDEIIRLRDENKNLYRGAYLTIKVPKPIARILRQR